MLKKLIQILSIVIGQTYSLSALASEINLELQTKTVGDQVEYSPNLPTGGFAEADRKTRFSENGLHVDWAPNSQVKFDVVVAKREFATLRDHFVFTYYEAGLNYKLTSDTSIQFTGSTNRSSELNKNSFTDIDQGVINSLSIRYPRDLRFQLSLNRLIPLNQNSTINVSGMVGAHRSNHDGVTGTMSRGDCQYGFDFTEQGGLITQIGQCGSVTSLQRNYPTDQTVEDDFGVSPVKDINNKARFSRIGLEYKLQRHKWNVSARYYYQRYFNSELDARIVSAGYKALNSNFVASVSAGYQLGHRIDLTVKLDYHKHRYLDEIPVLYTRLTSTRFEDDALFLSASLKYRLEI